MPGRAKNAEIARETLDLLEAGGYTTSDGRRVALADDLRRAVASTTLHRPGEFLADPRPANDLPRPGTTIEVTEESTLQAARRLALDYGVEPMVLSFASAKNPGGGFLNGAQAQEESLARSSGLYPCLLAASEFYETHRALRTTLYSDQMIFSPGVPVFRDDDGRLLETTYRVAFLTSPAVNAGVYLRDHPGSEAVVAETIRTRLAKVLWLALDREQTHLVLGAWGCGVFRNEPAMIAGLFRDALGPGGPSAGVFRHVVFAILDRPRPGRSTFDEFRDVLA